VLKAGSRKQEAGSRKQEAGGRNHKEYLFKPCFMGTRATIKSNIMKYP
jgi:hypothetical protein